MTPAARLQAVITILEELGGTSQPLDRFLRDWFRARRYAGSKDRRAIAERIFAIQRRRASLAWRLGDESPRALALASVLAEGGEPDALFTGDGYGPAGLNDTERAAIATVPSDPPLHVRGEFPEFLTAELTRAFGENLPAEMEAMQARAPSDLRVNTIKTTRDELLAALAAQTITARPTPFAPQGIRLDEGGVALAKSALFESGAFEFQDEAAQIATLLLGAAPGQNILDLAAGAGGKTLALAAAMQNTGTITACDIRGEALHQLTLRAARAGATNIAVHLIQDEPPPGPFDAIFLDAPCSGSGTWRRQPELKWRLTPARLDALAEIQDRLLDQAAARLKPQGRLVYATCSILPCENQDRVAAFLARHPEFTVIDAAKAWKGPPIPGLDRFFRASPATSGTDGFFCALLGRTEDAWSKPADPD
jgi:16S rRNA (cytosine967-C5)-methyltransferase